MQYILKILIALNNALFLSSTNLIRCKLPSQCGSQSVMEEYWYIYNEKANPHDSVMCNINSDEDPMFQFNESTKLDRQKCNSFNLTELYIIFRWTSPTTIFDSRFNIPNVMRFFQYFNYSKHVSLWGLNGFDLSIIDESHLTYHWNVNTIIVSKGRFDFYHNANIIRSCQDIVDFNIKHIESMFQIFTHFGKTWIRFFLRNLEYKYPICPLVFNNTSIVCLLVHDLVNTFYKRNILTFSNETLFTNLNSNIKTLLLQKAYNIDVDLNLVHPAIFKYTREIVLASWSFNSINGDIFMHLSKLYHIRLKSTILKKINHKQGIGWIKKINNGTNANLSIFNKNFGKPVRITFTTSTIFEMLTSLPDEDFCIYSEFPFSQLVILHEGSDYKPKEKELSCTYLWIAQYYLFYIKYILNFYNTTEHLNTPIMLENVLKSKSFKSISKCNFKERISLCNKSNYYHVEEVWDETDFFIRNKKIQTAFKISLYPVSFLGLLSNMIVVLVILNKENSDLFKGFKQYSYLCLNSIFCIMISVIEILSWMTECFYPFEVFCPEIRKLVAIQFFKIIFAECFVTMLRFMCNFSYVAFALNRIGLIGKVHGKLVGFVSELGVKKYIGATLFISVSLSWIKYFKYEINYFYPHWNFPISNELDIVTSAKTRFDDFYYIFNSICDLMNYLVFVIICVVIDICTVVQLHRTLREKAERNESMKQQQNENNNKSTENEEAVNKAIEMVVMNSTIGVFFKLPLTFIPILNLCAQFYFKNEKNKQIYPYFLVFYKLFLDGGFNSLIQDVSHLLFTLSLSIQMFIYKRFDKKFQLGYERLKNKGFVNIKATLFFKSFSSKT